jgi:integrase
MGQLTDLTIKSLKKGKHFDGHGLYLFVNDVGRYWRYDYRLGGKAKTMALGVYPEVSLAKARDAHKKARELRADGTDPSLNKRREKATRITNGENTFIAVAGIWLDKTAEQRKDNTTAKLMSWLERDVYPAIGKIPVAELSAPDVMNVLRRMEARGVNDSVMRVKQIISRIMAFAVTYGLAQVNPVTNIHNRDNFKKAIVKHHPAIVDPVGFGALLRAIAGYTGTYTTVNALKLAPLVFVRAAVLQSAEWSEIDWDQRLWVIPGIKMKGLKIDVAEDLIVPLSKQAIEILRKQESISGHRKLVFPGIKGDGKPISENTLNDALKTLGYKGMHVVHGFRASARTMMVERLGVKSEVIEMQLAHRVADMHGRAYNRTSFLDERMRAMQQWADYCDQLAQGGDVVKVNFAKSAA